MRGQYAHNTGVWTNENVAGPDAGGQAYRNKGNEKDNVATRLDAAGYRTALIGKYLSGIKNKTFVPPGWDKWFSIWGVGYFLYDANDQSRNVYRGSPLSYAQDEKALQLAVEGIELGMDRKLSSAERFFFWLPLGHSEDLALQERSVRHAQEEAAKVPSHRRAGAEFEVSQAKATRDVIARFGRHPHRNEILGRTSTPEELEYLKTETPPHLRRPPS
jgi:uncharacterized protein (DUF924 family)